MKYIELCAGLGGMGYGLMQAGWECAGYAECDTKCDNCKEYTQHLNYPKKKYYTVCSVCGTPKKQPTHESFKILHDPEERMWSAYDVRTVSDDDIRLLGRERGPIQGLVAGFPCQTFSIAGKRKGFEDAIRGTIFFEIVRFASILRPEFILLENVTGLLSHDKGGTFETIIGTLDELGYVGEWCVLNSAAYVPQNRERVFIVASLRGSGRPKVFPFGAENKNSVEVIGRVDINADDYCKRVYSPAGLSPCLPTMQGGSQEPKVLVTKQDNQLKIRQIATCLDANYFKGLDCHQQRTGVMEPYLIDDQGRLNKELKPLHISPTLRAQTHGNEPRVVNGYRIRKLTPLECFRLQSFPDEWYYKLKEAGISDSQLYKMAGNAVTSVVAYEIGRRLMA